MNSSYFVEKAIVSLRIFMSCPMSHGSEMCDLSDGVSVRVSYIQLA